MIAIRNKLYYYFRIRLGAIDYNRGWIQSECPYCGKPKKFGINLSANVTNCFRCGANPKPLDLLLELEGLNTYDEAVTFLHEEKYDGPLVPYLLRKEEELYKMMLLPETFFNIGTGNCAIAMQARNYVIKRGFSVTQLSRKGWGYCTQGLHKGFLIIPYITKGKLVYYNARNFRGNNPRYRNPTIDEVGVGKSMIMYNEDALSTKNTLYLCEGAINAETMGDSGIATMGKNISRYQLNQLIRSYAKRIIILFDPDAKEKSIKIAKELINHKEVKIIDLPEDKDVNDIGKQETLNLIQQTEYLKYNDLL